MFKYINSSLNAGIALNALAWSSVIVRIGFKEMTLIEGSQLNRMVTMKLVWDLFALSNNFQNTDKTESHS